MADEEMPDAAAPADAAEISASERPNANGGALAPAASSDEGEAPVSNGAAPNLQPPKFLMPPPKRTPALVPKFNAPPPIAPMSAVDDAEAAGVAFDKQLSHETMREDVSCL